MIVEKLIALGLSKNEASTYIELCKFGSATGGEIIRSTGFHRNIVYDNLEKLIEKGLASYIIDNSRKLFIAKTPESIKDFIDEEQKKIDEKKEMASDIIDELKPIIGKGSEKVEASMIRGVNALRAELNNIFDKKLDYLSFGAPDKSTDIMGAYYWKGFSKRVLEMKINGKLIFNESLRTWAKTIKTKQHKIRFFEKEFEPLSQTMIYGNTVMLIVWVQKPIATIIRNEEVASNYSRYFDMLWSAAIE